MDEKVLATRYLTVEETAELMRLSIDAVYRGCRAGTIPGAFKIGGSWRIDTEALALAATG
jgi:excisionase family DNA binding protein